MSSTGNVFPGSGSSVTRSATAWTSPGSVTADDAGDATCNSGASGSDYLVASGFGFQIPGGSTILGVTVRVEASEHTSGTESLNAQLQNDSGTLVGSSQGQTISGTGKAVYTYGGVADTLGASLTAAIVNDPDFGVRLWFTTTHDVRIDFVTVSIEYMPPVVPPDLPNPQRRREAGFTHLGVNLLLTTLAVVSGPETVNRAPLQTRIPERQIQQPFVVPNLLPLQSAQGVPFAQSEWSVPRGSIAPRPEAQPNALIGFPAPTPTVFRAPLYTAYAPKAYRQFEQVQNLVISRDGEKPFAQYDWPLTARKSAPGLQGPTNLLVGFSQPPKPFAQYDWTVPSRKASAGLAGPPNVLVGYPAPTPTAFRAPLYTPSVRKAVRQYEQTQNRVLLEQSAEFTSQEWGLLPERKFRPALYEPGRTSLALTNSQAPVTNPFAQYEWQNPARTKAIGNGEQRQVTILDSGQKPFAQNEWLVPGAQKALQPEVPPNLLIGFPEPTPTVCRTPLYTRTVPKVSRQYELPPNLVVRAPVGTAPFRSVDLPNPRGKLFPVSLRTWINQTRIVEDTDFTTQYWGLLPESRFRPSLYEPGKTSLALTGTQSRPFSQSQWPVPGRFQFPVALRTWTDRFKRQQVQLTGDFSSEAEFGAIFDAVATARAVLSAGLVADDALSGSADALAEVSTGISAVETLSGLANSRASLSAGVVADGSFAGQAGAKGLLTAGIGLGSTLSARAAAVALFQANLSTDDSEDRALGLFGSISDSVTASAVISALSDATAAMLAGVDLGESWAAHAQAAAQLAATGQFGAEFIAEVSGARVGAMSAGTEAAAVFTASAQTLASLTATASFGESIAAIAATAGQLSSGASFGATFQYLASNSSLIEAGVDVQDTFAITAATLGSLIATAGADATFAAISNTRAALLAGASFADAWTSVGGVSEVLPAPLRVFEVDPRRRTFEVDPRHREFVVTPSNRSFRFN